MCIRDSGHTDQCAAGDQQADALQQLHLTDGGHADGGGKEGKAAGQDGLAATYFSFFFFL